MVLCIHIHSMVRVLMIQTYILLRADIETNGTQFLVQSKPSGNIILIMCHMVPIYGLFNKKIHS